MEVYVQFLTYVNDATNVGVPDDLDFDDIRQSGNNTLPPETYATYLTDPDVLRRIGAKTEYVECSRPAHDQFTSTGDRKFSYSFS